MALLQAARSCRSATASSAPPRAAAAPLAPVARAASASSPSPSSALLPVRRTSSARTAPSPTTPPTTTTWIPRASPDGVAAATASAAAASAVPSSSSSAAAAAEREQLVEYAADGPLIASCGLTPDDVRKTADEWCALGARLALQLGFVPGAAVAAAAAAAPPSSSPSPIAFASLDTVQRLRIYRYYLPVFFWVRAQLDAHAREHEKKKKNSATSGSAAAPPPLVLGISAPQGCGKTTLTEQLTELFTYLGVRVAGVSIDDFYLTRREQQALADKHPGNRLLELRGNAGSHDLALGEACLAALRQCNTPEDEVAVPRYDKSAFEGKGDRAPESEWPRVQGPLQLVLFEGWMLGFRAVGGGRGGGEGGGGGAAPPSSSSSLTPDEQRDLQAVDAFLQSYAQRWDRFVDSWLVVRVGDPQWVYAWRLQAERAMRAKGKSGMTDEGIADFVSRYLPSYRQYLPVLYSQGPTTSRKGKTLVVEVDERRSPVEKQPPLPAGLME
jgi:D-glycerate 3-kinase